MDLANIDKHKVLNPYQPIKGFFLPKDVARHTIVEVDGRMIWYISDEVMNIEATQILEDCRRRQIPRFRYMLIPDASNKLYISG